MKKGLVLEGGAMRGLFTAGVIDVFLENNINFDGLIGVSAGAAFGCNMKSRQKGRTLRYNKRFCRDPRYCSVRSLITTGDLYGADFCYRVLPEQLDVFDFETFKNNPIEFIVVATDVLTGDSVYTLCESYSSEMMDWVRASASMPLVSRPVEINGRLYLDGGISDSIPLKHFEERGYGKNVVILTRPRGYIKNKLPLAPVMKLALRKYPRIYDALMRRHENYNNTLEYIFSREKQGDVFLICPEEPLSVGKMEKNPEKLEVAWAQGKKAAEQKLTSIKSFLN